MKDRLETIIKEYLKKEYGNENVFPKPVLEGLAEAINEKRWEIYSAVDEEYDLEDIETIAEEREYELTQDEKSLILHRYKKLGDTDIELLYDIVDEVVDKRKEK